jgi:hypothetical protein
VAVTRAREKLILVSSLRAADLDSTGKAIGLQRLHDYLRYAETAGSSRVVQAQVEEKEQPQLHVITGELKRRGYEVVSRFGRSSCRLDLAVRHPESPDVFFLGIDCDGPAYDNLPTARDRDRLRQEVLGRLGWRLHRIWSIDWVLRREEEIAHLIRAVEEAQKTGPPPTLPPAAFDPVEIDEAPAAPTAVTEEGYPPGVVSYRLCKLTVGKAFRDMEFHDPAGCDERCRLLVALVETEGPIHVEVVTRRLREAWGVERTGERVRRAVEEAIHLSTEKGRVRQKGEFLWPVAERAELVRARPASLHEMYREYIAPEEIQEALRLLVSQAVALPEDALLSAAASLFGYGRVGDALRQRLREQLAELLRLGVVVARGEQLVLGP